MKASLSWLKDYVSIEMDIAELAEALTMIGLEVESISERYEYLEKVLVGRIADIHSHPNADKLKVCYVDLGDRVISVVCGAPNVEKNMLAPVALPGMLLPDGSILSEGIIRGERSEGMICSEAELGLGADQSGIMVLDSKQTVGNRIANAFKLSDPVLEFDLTPNRPDCLSIIGIAREIAAIQQTRVKYPEIILLETDESIFDLSSVTIETPDHCPRYAARLLEDIRVASSPFWLQDRLMSVGLRPINNIVDITNFVMMETGQPLHAFDFDRLAENRIVVRTAEDGESFTTLDEKDRVLTEEMLLICDGKSPVAVAGVMGGLNSEIEDKTTRVLIESAYFNPVSIRKTSKKLGLSTEASHRFERGVDPEGTVKAANRAAQLMAEIARGKILKGVIDEHPRKTGKKTIHLSVDDTNRILGINLNPNEMKSLLQSIEFEVNDEDGYLAVAPPTFRVDVERQEDIMEEVARLSGYNNIPTTFPLIPADTRTYSPLIDLRNRIKTMLIGFGFTETINYSFISKHSCDLLGLPPDDLRTKTVNILNPLTEEQAVMRTSLIPGLIETVRRNFFQQIRNLRLFEIGKVYISNGKDALPDEIEMLTGIWTGASTEHSWNVKETACDFYDTKGIVEGLLNALNVRDTVFTQMSDNLCWYTRPGYTARIIADSDVLGLVGEVAPQILRNYDVKQPAFIFEINLDILLPLTQKSRYAEALPKFPAISRDITMIVDKNIETHAILKHVSDFDEKLVESLQLFDMYVGDPIPGNKKSISFRITYRSDRETLEDETVNRLHREITNQLVEAFDAMLPG
jgi:phenylalanyl-tRNA synthetase beta chain